MIIIFIPTVIHDILGTYLDRLSSVFNTSKSETATFGAKTRQKPPQFFSLKTATILAQTATILEISDFFP